MELQKKVEDRSIETPTLLYSMKHSFFSFSHENRILNFFETCFIIFLVLRHVTEPHEIHWASILSQKEKLSWMNKSGIPCAP